MTGDAPTSAPTPGTLVGVGVGPGDPELVTRLAIRRLEEADRVVAPTTAPDAVGRAEAIVRQVLPRVRIDRVHFDMTADDRPGGRAARSASHAAAARSLAPWLRAGETVAFVTLGDPNIYSTFPSLAAAAAELVGGLSVQTVPGIMAFQALAACSATVLLDGTESLALVTALDGTAHVAEALGDPDRAVVVYKGGRHLPEVTSLLADHGRLDGAVFGELLGLPGERIMPVAAAGVQPATYLATVIVPPSSRAPANRQQDASAWTPSS
ncbi:MAG: precorrin-2 C(20)-methyltransferase [Actinomycetota bacterium]|jgi:precorrin-2/cobalt-factor-2 C20-methyltransferase|nr:precorrin-2 C(20)-methyltransferase [Actinomycetota bacterium]